MQVQTISNNFNQQSFTGAIKISDNVAPKIRQQLDKILKRQSKIIKLTEKERTKNEYFRQNYEAKIHCGYWCFYQRTHNRF